MYPGKSPHPRDIKKSQQYSVDLEEATLLGPSLTSPFILAGQPSGVMFIPQTLLRKLPVNGGFF